VNTLREQWIARGYSKSHAYDATLYVMAGLLLLGFLCNQAVRRAVIASELSSPTAPPLLAERGEKR
jgi:hypothetical protein